MATKNFKSPCCNVNVDLIPQRKEQFLVPEKTFVICKSCNKKYSLSELI